MQDDSSHADLEDEAQALHALMGDFRASHRELDDLTTAYSDGGLAPLPPCTVVYEHEVRGLAQAYREGLIGAPLDDPDLYRPDVDGDWS